MKISSIIPPKFRPYFVLTLGVILACIPGVWLARFAINEFDEPYQIMNAYDWANAPYSPLSSFISHFIGEVFQWKWLAFRYLALILNTTAILAAGIYAVRHSSRKAWIILTTIACTFFCTSHKGDTVFFGWDAWTNLTVTFALIVLLSYLRKHSFGKIILLSIISGAVIFMRLPNISIIPIVAILIFLKNLTQSSKSTKWIISSVYIISTSIVGYLIIVALYGSLYNFIQIFESNTIAHHDPPILFKSFTIRLFYCLLLAVGIGLINMVLRKRNYNSFKISTKIFTAIFIFVVFIILLFSFNALAISKVSHILVSSFELYLLFEVIKRSWPKVTSIKSLSAMAVFSMASICAIGSNTGFFKFMTWSSLPLAVMLAEKYFTKSIKLLFITALAAIIAFYIYAIPNIALFDDGVVKTTYRFSGGVLDGMYTSPVRGEYIDEIRRNAKHFEDKGFDITVVRSGNNYIWEYLFLKRNEFFRHKFNNWHMLNDPQYAADLIQKMENSEKPPLLLYMDCDYDEPTAVQRALENKMIRVADGGCYCFYAFQSDVMKYYPDCPILIIETPWYKPTDREVY